MCIRDSLRGGADKVIEAGAVLVGGHSIKDKEPKYGLSVTGIAHPSEIWTNAGAKPGDVLIITKPLGVGIITAALKKKGSQESDMTEEVIIPPEVEQKAFEVMLELNARGAITAKSFQVPVSYTHLDVYKRQELSRYKAVLVKTADRLIS